jgi:hypothetical protein
MMDITLPHPVVRDPKPEAKQHLICKAEAKESTGVRAKQPKDPKRGVEVHDAGR